MHLLTNLVAWIFFGAIAGWVTAHLMHLRTGFWQNTMLGITGALIGGAIVTLLGGSGVTGFNIYSLIISIGGACLFTWLVRKLEGSKRS